MDHLLAGSTAVLLVGIVIAAAYFSCFSGITNSIFISADPKMPVAKVAQDGVTVSILSSDGEIHAKDNVLQIKFQDSGGHPVDAVNVKLELNMSILVVAGFLVIRFLKTGGPNMLAQMD